MPRTGGAQRRSQIVEHAARLFRERGYHQVSIRDILRATNTSKGSFYFHFASKRELGKAVVEYYYTWLPAMFREVFNAGSWDEVVGLYAAEFVGTFDKPRMLAAPLVFLGMEFAGMDENLLDMVAQVLKFAEGRVAKALLRYGYPAATHRRRGASVFACMEGHILRIALYQDPRCIKQLVRNLAALGRPPGTARCDDARPESGSDEAVIARVEEFMKYRLDMIDNRSIIDFHADDTDGFMRTRGRILLEAAKVFWCNGYNATSLADVLKACDVPKGSFYYYFKSKKALALEVLDNYEHQIAALMEIIFSAGSWDAAMDGLGSAIAALGIPDEVCAPLGSMGLEFGNVDPPLRSKSSRGLKVMEKAFADGIRRYFPGAANVADKAALAMALCEGHLARLVIYRDPKVLDQMQEDMKELVALV